MRAGPRKEELELARLTELADLSHPHLIRIFKAGHCQIDDVRFHYVVMEFVEEDVSQILPERALAPAETTEMLNPVVEALGYLHGKGFVHGRIKPANIMAIGDQVKLSSDSLCRLGQTNSGSAQPSAYDAPESREAPASPAGDVWSLGMTLVEVLTQRLPVWEASLQTDPVVPETVPPPFREIARNCLVRNPQRRVTVAGIAARLRQALQVPEAVMNAKAPEARTANWRYVIVSAAGVLILAGIFISPRLLDRRKERQRVLPSSTVAQSQIEMPAAQTGEKPLKNGVAGAVSSAAQSPASSGGGQNVKTPIASNVSGQVLQEVQPEVPLSARNTIRGTVRVTVRVKVDSSGSVVRTVLEAQGPSRYFAGLASQAASRWQFVPPKVKTQAVSSEWLLRFEFNRATTRVFPTQALP
jgi:TonB family protein